MVRLLAILFFLSIGLAACGGDRSTIPTDAAGDALDSAAANGGAGGPGGASTTGIGADGSLDVTPVEPGQDDGPLSRLVIYFDFDRSEIRSDFSDMLRAHGAFLAENTGRQVRLEGHADERGSREYNIGLGEQRAQAVRRVLMLQGASADQLGTVSYGEERPAALGSDENSYSLNRRVELVYR